MTPLLRQKILDAMNNARQTVKNGQMLLSEGEYALPAAEMPDLVWNCEKEEELHEFLQDYCEAYPFMNGNFPTQINLLDISWNHFGLDVSDYDTFIQNGITINPTFGMFTSNFMAHSPIFTGSSRLDVYYSKAETLACAMYDCEVGNKVGNGYPAYNTNYVHC
uniref:Uncharacterized protein n=1 Tax=Panagrolaimus superbus TaxID=310955 RepID=A0A914YGX9_9BILA